MRHESARVLTRVAILAGGIALGTRFALVAAHADQARLASALAQLAGSGPPSLQKQAGAALAGHGHLLPSLGASVSGYAGSLAHVSRIAFAAAVAAGAVALLAAPRRRLVLRRVARWLTYAGLFGLLETWIVPRLLAREVKGGSYHWLENSLLQTAAPMRDIYEALLAAGIACALLALLLARAEHRSAVAAEPTPAGEQP